MLNFYIGGFQNELSSFHEIFMVIGALLHGKPQCVKQPI